MSPDQWAGLLVSITVLVSGFAISVRWLVKHYLSELKPNSGSSLNDRVGRVETQIDAIYRLLVTRSYADHPTNRLYEEPDC